MSPVPTTGAGDSSFGPSVSPFVSDSMTDTTGTALTSHVGETGATWTLQTGHTLTGSITDANRWRCATNASASGCQASGIPINANYRVSATLKVVSVITGTANTTGVIGRASASANTFYHARLVPNTSVVQLFRFNAGVATQMGSDVAVTISAGDTPTLALTMAVDQISLVWNGSTLIGPLTDASITTAAFAGLRGSGTGVLDATGVHIDSLTAVPL